MTTRPGHGEAAPYYFTYIDLVPDGDICALLESSGRTIVTELRAIPATLGSRRYAADKWTLAEVVGHLSDTERLFQARAFWFARGFDTPLPSFDQQIAIATAGAGARSWTDLVDEFAAVRASTLPFYRAMPAEAWDRSGIASDSPFTVRALAYLTAGHALHHMALVREKYLEGGAARRTSFAVGRSARACAARADRGRD